MNENNKFLSFRGIIGRRWFLLRSLLALLIPILCLTPILLFGHFSGSNGTNEALSVETFGRASNTLGLFIVIPWMVLNFLAMLSFFVIVLGLQVRRGRDVFRQVRPRPMIELIVLLIFWATKGFFGIGGLVLLIWPGVLAQQTKTKKLIGRF